MTERKESLSAAMDGQIESDLYQELLTDPELKASWHRYHLIGDAMRNELPSTLQLNIADQVALALENEPTLLAPIASETESKSESKRFALPDNVVQFGQRFGQYAIAATVAAMAVVGVQQYNRDEALAPLPVLETMPLLGAPSPASYQIPGAGMGQAEEFAREQERIALEQQRRANAFLQDHLLQQRLNSGQLHVPAESQPYYPQGQ